MQQESSAHMRNVLGVIGTSGSGKTTLLEFLIARLAAQGLKVNAVSYTHLTLPTKA